LYVRSQSLSFFHEYRRVKKGHETMTLLTAFSITPTHRGSAVAPHELSLTDLTIVVPVKNDQIGVTRLLEACLKAFTPNCYPKAILLVDNLSEPPLEVPTHLTSSFPVHLLICAKPGAAAARNLGSQQAETPWILFLDSDCLPTPGLIDGYRQAMNGAVAYAGMVKAERSDLVSRYYDAQSILIPPPLWDNGQARPAYLITANALVWRPALVRIGGFNEHFPSAGGEDTDLGIRLWSVGPLSYAPVAQVLHTFEPKLRAFMSRFVRYGRGNRRLAARYQAGLAPHPFVPHNPSPINWVLGGLQFLALWWGYHKTRPDRGWSVPLSSTVWSKDPLEVGSVHMEQFSLQNSPEVSN
jgi:GT2 family glycosyltransferase